MFNEKQSEEKQYDTERLKSLPKRISVQGGSKKSEFTFKEIKFIKRVVLL